jgi:hypothetical protein
MAPSGWGTHARPRATPRAVGPPGPASDRPRGGRHLRLGAPAANDGGTRSRSSAAQADRAVTDGLGRRRGRGRRNRRRGRGRWLRRAAQADRSVPDGAGGRRWRRSRRRCRRTTPALCTEASTSQAVDRHVCPPRPASSARHLEPWRRQPRSALTSPRTPPPRRLAKLLLLRCAGNGGAAIFHDSRARTRRDRDRRPAGADRAGRHVAIAELAALARVVVAARSR